MNNIIELIQTINNTDLMQYSNKISDINEMILVSKHYSNNLNEINTQIDTYNGLIDNYINILSSLDNKIDEINVNLNNNVNLLKIKCLNDKIIQLNYVNNNIQNKFNCLKNRYESEDFQKNITNIDECVNCLDKLNKKLT